MPINSVPDLRRLFSNVEPENSETASSLKRIDMMLAWLQNACGLPSGERPNLEDLLKSIDGEPDSLDAWTTWFMKFPQPMAIKFMKELERKSREHLQRVLGPASFEPGARDFWGIDEARPYLRVLGTLGWMYMKEKHWEEAVAMSTQILRLGNSDQSSLRLWMGALLLRAGRPADALYFTQRWMESPLGPPGGGLDFSPPRRTPMTAAKYLETAQNPLLSLQLTYTAALAAFTLDGNSELARQYLHIAAQHPRVLIKVLGRFPERASADLHAIRLVNGTEETRDHLWLAQELWMQEDVWNWASNDAFVRERVHRGCDDPTCRKKEDRIGQWQKCSGCTSAWYCSSTCQKAHWRSHKESCKMAQSIARARPTIKLPEQYEGESF
ncbi:hypothetical protein FB451DRAFT_311491 [Mycena latifolia]|nr:hypothetical protein FB451DRAFT_311491 [Mycena latifolia]